ncbi:MAG: tripartite tricarboxylate transporter TctB family protein [Burkholderiales bacterium]|nr:tripartite tricarboxylate transporter TctB family protein [Burkholderiales bacterium]
MMNWLHGKDGRDLIAGGLLIVIGIFCAIYASQHYPLGDVSRMGPGMFPTVLGYVLAGLGVLIALPAWFRSGSLPKPEYKPLFFVLLGTLVFALTVERIGVVPAIFLLTGLAVLADNKLGIIGTLVLAAALSAASVLIFLYGLGIPIYPFVWPF